MNTFVDLQFANMLSGQLERFVVKHRNPYKANFRCPICGDSAKSKTKARAWILQSDKTGSFHFHCHNCGSSQSFSNFLKTYNPTLYGNYITEKFIDKSKAPNLEEFKTETKLLVSSPLKNLKKISQLKHDHPAKLYIESRQIPTNQHYRIYYHPKFMGWVNSVLPGKFTDVTRDEPRLVIPLIDKHGKVFGVSSRGFNPKGLRYITIMFEDKPKLFGLEKVDFSKPYFIVEGALDAMFLANSIAMVGADTALDGIEKKENATFVYDAEPRNLEICRRMEKQVKLGHKICIWPKNILGKDINDMFLNGVKDIQKIITDNTYNGLSATLKMAEWRKV